MLKQRYPGRKPTFTETCTINYMDNGQSCIYMITNQSENV